MQVANDRYELMREDARFVEERQRLPLIEVEELPAPVQPPILPHQIVPAFLRLQAE